MVNAIEPEYLKELRDPQTDKINVTIAEVLEHLFDTYGLVDSETLDDCQRKSHIWSLSDPYVTIFNAIEESVALAEAAQLPQSQGQMNNYALDVIRKTSDFEHALTAWYSRPVAEHTWANFKSHFTMAHRALKKVRGTTMCSTAHHQAHLMEEHISDDIQQLKSEVLAKVDALVTPNPHQSDSSGTLVPPSVPIIYASTAPPKSDPEVLHLLAQRSSLIPIQMQRWLVTQTCLMSGLIA